MNGIRLVAAYLGVAWLLASLGTIWSSCSPAPALKAFVDSEIAEVGEETQARLAELAKLREKREAAAQKKLDQAKEKLSKEQDKAEKAAADIASRIAAAEKDLEKAKKVGSGKKIRRANTAIERLEKQRITSAKKSDAAAETVAKAEAALKEVGTEIDAKMAEANKKKDEAITLINEDLERSAGKLTFKPILALVLGLALLAAGLFLHLVGGRKIEI